VTVSSSGTLRANLCSPLLLLSAREVKDFSTGVGYYSLYLFQCPPYLLQRHAWVMRPYETTWWSDVILLPVAFQRKKMETLVL
jgi:hypothetical protein